MMDDRAVTVPLTYVLIVGIVALLAAGLFASASGLVDGQQDRAVRTGLEVVGNRLAGDVAATGRLARTVDGPEGRVVTDVSLPDRVAGARYLVEIGPPTGDVYPITLTTVQPAASVTVYVKSKTPIAPGRYAGGDLRMVYDASTADPRVVVSSG